MVSFNYINQWYIYIKNTHEDYTIKVMVRDQIFMHIVSLSRWCIEFYLS